MVSRYHSSLLTKEYKVLWGFFFFFFGLLWVFTAARGLSLVAELGGYSLGCVCGRLLAVASRCRAGALGRPVSVVRALGL